MLDLLHGIRVIICCPPDNWCERRSSSGSIDRILAARLTAYATQQRTPKLSASFYREVAARNRLV